MNLSSMMYRLNVQQQQQQQQQEGGSSTITANNSTTNSTTSTATNNNSSIQQQQQQQQQQHQAIPSHILLQQQLNAAAVAVAAAAAANATTPTEPPLSGGRLHPHPAAATASAIKMLAKNSTTNTTVAAIKQEPLHDVIALTKLLPTTADVPPPPPPLNGQAAVLALNSGSGGGSNVIALTVGSPAGVTTPSPGARKVSTTPPTSTINLVVSPVGAGGGPVIIAASGSSRDSSAAAAGGGSNSSNGHLVFVPSKRPRLDGADEWISTPSPGSVPSTAPPLSPSPGSQNHSYSANLSNGYASPMSAGSYSPKTGRDDLSPSSSLNGYSTNEGCDAKKSKKGPAPRLQEELCLVCGDRASGYHYNALTCEGCKGFFRRSVTKNASYCCKFGRACEMDMYMRRKCQECRLKKCLAVGMRPECVVPENQCAMKRREKKAQKEKDKQQSSPSAVSTTDIVKKEILDLMTCEPPTHTPCPLLPEEILAKCQARNIPPLTVNQLAVIYKLIWYQDGYEQPSEEDLKRIMSTPDENESPHDVNFRHITEITILTVQLIVEFAKGLPAFTKIPQEDQITLLKACSSEVMMLRMARRYDHSSDSIFFANNRSYTRDAYKMAGVADNIEDLLHFCRIMYAMKVDNVEYALLTAIVIFSDRPGLEEAELVELIQSYYIDTLRIYILNRHCGDPMSFVFFAKLLSILTELRTLGNQNAEMCFSLKLKNRKLPKFLEEIWDVHAIPPSVQSHIQATQAEKAALEAADATTVTATPSSSSSSTSSLSSASSAVAVAAGVASSTVPGIGVGVGALNVGIGGVHSTDGTITVVAAAPSSTTTLGGLAASSSTTTSSSSVSVASSTSSGGMGLYGSMVSPLGVVPSPTPAGLNGGVTMYHHGSPHQALGMLGVAMKQEHMLSDENSTMA